uniref:NADH-ubiquinone oxidoreductase chain 4L n=1 Tax=Curculionoidea sp. 29 KM-2017 TaxID=2219413 RepID=A0A346RIE0_9CUCU|nr:NADH dehydrogenase subunit 4L [Curculionoidea sp. 29 KM-2017]
MMILSVILIFFLSGIYIFCLNYKHLLILLLSLEFIILSLMLIMFMYLSNFMFENYFSMIFLTMSVCESVLGLSILVLLIRSHGNDYMKMFNLLW